MAGMHPMELEGWALRFISSALARELPEFSGKASQIKLSEVRQPYFRLHRIIEVLGSSSGNLTHVAYRPDTSSVFLLTGRPHCLRLLASIDPVVFKSADDVVAYSTFADQITTEDTAPPVPISSADELTKVIGAAKNGDLELVNEIREKVGERVQPPEKSVLPYGFQERYHIVCGDRLIERTRTVVSGGIFFRHDEVLAANLPL